MNFSWLQNQEGHINLLSQIMPITRKMNRPSKFNQVWYWSSYIYMPNVMPFHPCILLTMHKNPKYEPFHCVFACMTFRFNRLLEIFICSFILQGKCFLYISWNLCKMLESMALGILMDIQTNRDKQTCSVNRAACHSYKNKRVYVTDTKLHTNRSSILVQ